jgi:hypothetical protein
LNSALTPATYFDEIKPLLPPDDRLKIALGVNDVTEQLNIDDLFPPYPRRDLGTYVVTVFANSR